MINRGKYSVLGVGILAVEYEYAAHRVIEAARQRTSLSVAALLRYTA